MPVLLLATYRPGYQPPWLWHSAATQMALPRLSPRESLVVLQSVPQAAQLPAPLHQAIVAKAAGNPFFVEELTWAAVEHGDHTSPLPLPDTIEAVLAARLDRLPPEAKRLAQIAAVIGPEVGDLDKSIAVLEHGLGLCQVWNIGGWVTNMTAHLGYAYALSGRITEAVLLLEQAVGQSVSSKIGPSSLWTAYLSEAYLLAGRRDEALPRARHALGLSSEHNLQGERAWALRLLGQIVAQPDPPESEPAANYYQQALNLAAKLGMRPLQAHCYLGLGTLYAQTGQREQARAALAAAIALYRAMDMSFWLPPAEAALAQVE